MDPMRMHCPVPGYAVTIHDCGRMPAGYRPSVLPDPAVSVHAARSAPAARSPALPSPVVTTPVPATASLSSLLRGMPPAAGALPGPAGIAAFTPSKSSPTQYKRVSKFGRRYAFMAVEVATPVGVTAPTRVVFELFGSAAPAEVERFMQLCSGSDVRSSCLGVCRFWRHVLHVYCSSRT